MSEIINTDSAAKPLGAYPHARRVGNLLFLSGIGSRNAKDNTIPGLELDAEGNIIKYDIEAETLQVFANVKAVLEASGSSSVKGSAIRMMSALAFSTTALSNTGA